jgi:hypothetical protein
MILDFRYQAFQLPKNRVHPGSVSFRLIERRATIHVKLARGPKLIRI